MRTKYLLPSLYGYRLGVVLLVGILLSSFFVSLFPTKTTYAAGEQYIFAYPTDQEKIDYLSDVFKDKKMDDPSLKGTAVYAKDGIWGNGIAAELNYGKPYLPDGVNSVCDYYDCGGVSSDNKFFYTTTYSCAQDPSGRWEPTRMSIMNGYSVQFVMMVDLGPNFDNADHSYNTFTGRVTQRPSNNQVPLNELPSGCRVPNSSGRMKNYSALSEAQKNDWGIQRSVDTLNSAFTLENENGGADEADVCDGLGDLAWIVCPIVKATLGTINALDNMINDLLTVDTRAIFNTTDPGSSGARYKQAWSTFRTIALGLIAIVALIVIISTAFGLEILDAYTIRKVLPRFLIAIIFITLSWSVMNFLIQLSNDVGNGVRALIYLPFDDMALNFNAASGLFSWVVLGGTIAATGFSLIGFLSLAVTGLLAVLIAFLILILRELIIIFLVIIAPIGIVCLILPNTRKGWQLWQNTFTAMLIVFPIISAMIATGRVFAITITNNDSSGAAGDVVNNIIAFIAYILPYFLLPFAFRAAGGLMATLAGIGNDRSKGMFDRLSNFRENKRQKRYQDAIQGKNNLARTPIGSIARRAHLADQGGFSLTPRGRATYRQATQGLFDQAAAKMLEEGGGRAFNDDDASALAVRRGMTRGRFIQDYMNMGHTRDDAMAALGRAESAVGAVMGSDAMAIAAQKFRIASTNTAYDAGPGGLRQLQAEVQDMVDRRLITTHDAAGWMKANRGRADYSSNAYGGTVDFLEGRATAEDQIAGAFNGADPRDILGAHQRSVETFAAHAQDHLSHAMASGDQHVIDNAMADVANIHSILSSVSPNKAVEFANTVLSQPSGQTAERQVVDANGRTVMDPVVDASGNPVMRRTDRVDASGNTILEPVMRPRTEVVDLTVRQYIDRVRSDERNHPAFHDRSREYASAREAAASGGAAPPPTEPGD